MTIYLVLTAALALIYYSIPANNIDEHRDIDMTGTGGASAGGGATLRPMLDREHGAELTAPLRNTARRWRQSIDDTLGALRRVAAH